MDSSINWKGEEISLDKGKALNNVKEKKKLMGGLFQTRDGGMFGEMKGHRPRHPAQVEFRGRAFDCG